MQRIAIWSSTFCLLLAILAAPRSVAEESVEPSQAEAAEAESAKNGAEKSESVVATVDCTLPSKRRHIRQFVYDGDEATYYESAEDIAADTSFTFKLDEAVLIKSVSVLTGNDEGDDPLKGGVLEAAGADGEFREIARFADGKAAAESVGEVKTLRIRPDVPKEGEEYRLVIREITIDSDPEVAKYEYPVEFFVVVEDAEDLEKWAEACARLCERQYPMINRELASEGFKPATAITMRLTSEYRGVAATSGGRIIGSVEYFRRHQDDMGAMVHETAHVVQAYRSRRNPGWLVEGVADYIRFVIYEPENIGGFNPRRARHNQSYRTSARFLSYVTDTYDKEIVKKLNKAMREGDYREELWQEYTGKSLADLGAEWYDSINAPKQPAPAAES